MHAATLNRKKYVCGTTEEMQSLSSCSSAIHKGLTYDTENSMKRTSTEEFSPIQNGLRKLSSMNRMKAFTRLGSHNSYEQIRQDRQQPSSDTTTQATGIFSSSTHHHRDGEGGGPAMHHGDEEEEEVAVKFDEPTATGEREPFSNGGNIDPKRGPRQHSSCQAEEDVREPFSNGGNIDPKRGTRQQQSSCPAAEDVREKSSTRLLRDVDSFDDEDQFERQRRVSTGGRHTSSTIPGAGAAPFVPGLSTRPKLQSCSPGYRREGEVGSQASAAGFRIPREGSYDFWNDVLLRDGSVSGECPSSGGVGSNRLNSAKPPGRKGKSFDFGILPEVDPPTKLIGAFLQRQTESGSNFLDLDLEMDELTPANKKPEEGSLSPLSDIEERSASPQTNPFLKDSSYDDLCRLDRPVTSSVPASFKAGAQSSPNTAEYGVSKDPLWKHNSDPMLFPQEGKQDVTINVDGDERYLKSKGEAATGATGFTNSLVENGNARVRSPVQGPAGVRWRKNGSFRPGSPSVPPAEVEVLKAPAQYVVRPTYSRLKSRLADLPKPLEVGKSSGTMEDIKGAEMQSGQARNSGQLKSGNKLKRVAEEEEEDPLKVSDLPEKFRKRDKGFWAVMQWLGFICIAGTLASILAFPYLRRMKRGGLVLWKWALLVMVIFSGRLISGWIIWVLVFIIEKNFLLRKRVVYFVYALRKGVQNCLWLGFALLAWHLMIDPKVDNSVKVVKYVSKILVCFLVAAIIVLVKTLIVKVFASSFHVNNYFERIQEALFNQYIMETLSGPPVVDFMQNIDEEKRLNEEIACLREAGASGPSLSKIPDLPAINLRRSSGLPGRPSFQNLKSGMMGTQSGMIGKSPKAVEAKNKSPSKAELNEGISVEHLQRLDISNISAWNMKRLMHIIKNSTLTHSLEESVYASDGMETEIQSEWQAKSAAKQIFKNVAKPGQKVITEDDLLRFMGVEETKKALPLFDGAIETKAITKQALKNWVVNVYRERRALALSLNDTKTAVNKLHRIVDVVVAILIIIIWLLVLGIATTKLLLFMSSQILLLILVWGNTLKTVFEAIVFLFVMHPFDVGDRCVVDGMQLVVEEMNILTTVFLGDCNVKIWFPNSVLATKPIQNYYRSPEMGDGVEFIVHASTPVEKIAAFKEKIGRYITSKPNHWHEDYALNVLQMSEGERMKLALGVKHTMNYQDMGEIVKRRSDLLLEVQYCLTELSIEYHLPAQEVHIRKRTD